jgi:hypothetical protein
MTRTAPLRALVALALLVQSAEGRLPHIEASGSVSEPEDVNGAAAASSRDVSVASGGNVDAVEVDMSRTTGRPFTIGGNLWPAAAMPSSVAQTGMRLLRLWVNNGLSEDNAPINVTQTQVHVPPACCMTALTALTADGCEREVYASALVHMLDCIQLSEVYASALVHMLDCRQLSEVYASALVHMLDCIQLSDHTDNNIR